MIDKLFFGRPDYIIAHDIEQNRWVVEEFIRLHYPRFLHDLTARLVIYQGIILNAYQGIFFCERHEDLIKINPYGRMYSEFVNFALTKGFENVVAIWYCGATPSLPMLLQIERDLRKNKRMKNELCEIKVMLKNNYLLIACY